MAGDVWVIHGQATTQKTAIVDVGWHAGAVLHNLGDRPATVRLVDVSAGVIAGAQETVIPAGESMTMRMAGLSGASANILWVTHLVVPPEVRVEGRLELWEVDRGPTGRPPALTPYTKLTMPVFERLSAAGEEQVHFGADLGGRDARVNVAIYNASQSAAASAHLSLSAPFCSQVLSEQVVLIPPNEIVQIRLDPVRTCLGDELRPGWLKVLKVRVDQPSFSIVSVLSNDTAPDATAAVSATDPDRTP